jgi:peptidoglycan/LPS O-acetylase OafA/YrhL
VLGVPFGPLDPVIEGGNSGVYIFFALSGYLLYRPFLSHDVDLGSYAVKRAARILPGYYVALIGLMVLTRTTLPLEHPVPFLGIASSYDIGLRSFLGSAWTLSAEVIFYVTLPLIARLARGREIRVLVALATTSIALQVALFAVFDARTEWLVGAYPFVVYAFVPGMLLAVMELRYREGFRRLRTWPYLVAGVVVIAIGCLAHAIPIAAGAGIGTPILMGWLLQQQRVPNARALEFLGGASYAMYLWHKDAFEALGIGGLAIALVASALSWAAIERPILGWAHRIARVRAARPIGATTG